MAKRHAQALHEIFDSHDDVLLLDEPTNDLDFVGLALLERFVARTPAAIVVVSHDRAFLERAVERVVEFEAGTRRVREYAGSWAEYERSRDAARRGHEAAYPRYVAEREQLEALRRARRGDARGGANSRARRAARTGARRIALLEGRNAERRLERLKAVEKPWEPGAATLELDTRRGRRSGRAARRSGGRTWRVHGRAGLARAPDRRPACAPSARDGSGKTTLLQALLGELPLARGFR